MGIRQLITGFVACSVLSINAASDFTVAPASGTYASLESFTFTFPEAGQVENGVTGYGNAVKLVPQGSDPASYSGNFCFKMSAEGNTVTFGFNSPFTTEGAYSLYVPKTAVKIDGATMEEDILIAYTVGEAQEEEPGDECLEVDGFKYTVTPAQGPVAAISEIVVAFPEATELSKGTLSWANAPKLVKNGLDPNMSSNCNFCFNPVVDGNKITFGLQKTEENPGEYDFYLYAGVVVVDGSPLTTDLIFKYNIEAAEYKLEAVGETELNEIKSLTFAVNPSQDVSLSDPEAELILVDTFSNIEYKGTVSVDGNQLIVAFDEVISTPAPYTLTVPQGFFKVAGLESNRDWVFEYRIKGTGDFTYEITPKEGTVEELEYFEIVFSGSKLGIGSISDVNNPILMKGSSLLSNKIEARITGQSLILQLGVPIGSRGEYTLIIPRGLLRLNGETPENDLRFTYTVDPTSGISEIAPDDDTTEFFNLQGVRIHNPKSGIFLRKSNGSVSKILIK